MWRQGIQNMTCTLTSHGLPGIIFLKNHVTFIVSHGSRDFHSFSRAISHGNFHLVESLCLVTLTCSLSLHGTYARKACWCHIALWVVLLKPVIQVLSSCITKATTGFSVTCILNELYKSPIGELWYFYDASL